MLLSVDFILKHSLAGYKIWGSFLIILKIFLKTDLYSPGEPEKPSFKRQCLCLIFIRWSSGKYSQRTWCLAEVMEVKKSLKLLWKIVYNHNVAGRGRYVQVDTK